MKIERISDEQIKFILSKEDLSHHNIKISDLSQGSEKMHVFFREMMTQAMLEFEFTADTNTPLIVETIPLPNDSIMIVVTKAGSHEYIESKLNLIPKARDERKYRKKTFIDNASLDQPPDPPISIYVFKKLDEIGEVASRLAYGFKGLSTVYKNQNKYFLVLHNDNEQNRMDSFETILCEYAQKQSSSYIYKMHLDEYGELIISNSALQKLADIYSKK